MKKSLMILLATGSFALAGCNMTSDQRYATGGLVGAAAGVAAADALDSSGTGKAIGGLAGAAAGSAIAARTAPPQQRQCQYANGAIGPCPVGY